MAEIGKDRLVELSDAKLRDAKLLLNSGGEGNAYYLAGYAVELMLKAIIATQFKSDTIPDRELARNLFVHNIEKLAILAKLQGELKSRADLDPDFYAYWEMVLSWNEQSRYASATLEEARTLIEAIDNQPNGVLSWLRSKL
ncbi:hypothetical protein [Tardiphaga sp.]|jgi:hypothetical protein|uniref:hypothetical protein n=1 Tax=Tardiphaga sp. TaxID=1926292 RepID=UPI0037DA1B32